MGRSARGIGQRVSAHCAAEGNAPFDAVLLGRELGFEEPDGVVEVFKLVPEGLVG